MKRRDFVRGLAVTTAAAGAALGQQKGAAAGQNPVPSTNPLDQGTQAVAPNSASPQTATQRLQQASQFHTPNIPVSMPDVVATTDAGYFAPARYATLVHLCDVLMPASSGYPSAVQAGAPEFLDYLIGASPIDRQAMYNNGLDRLNADSIKLSKVAFAKADAKQADAVIRPHLRSWINDHPPLEPHENFIALVHRDIRTAAMNSPAWAAAADAAGERTPGIGLYWAPIDPGIETWVSHGEPKGSAPLTRHAHA